MTGRMSGSRTMSILPERGDTSALDSRMSMKNHICTEKRNRHQADRNIWRQKTNESHHGKSPAGGDIRVLPPPLEQKRVSENDSINKNTAESRGPRSNNSYTNAHSSLNNNDSVSIGSMPMEQPSFTYSRPMALSTPTSKKIAFSSNTAPGSAENHIPRVNRSDLIGTYTPNGLKPRQSLHLLRSKVHSTLTADIGRTSSPVTSIASSMDDRNRFYGGVNMNQSKTNGSGGGGNRNENGYDRSHSHNHMQNNRGNRRPHHRSPSPQYQYQSSDLVEFNSNMNTPSSHGSVTSRHQYSWSSPCSHSQYQHGYGVDSHSINNGNGSNMCQIQSASASASFSCLNSSRQQQQQHYLPRKPFMDILPNRTYNNFNSSLYPANTGPLRERDGNQDTSTSLSILPTQSSTMESGETTMRYDSSTSVNRVGNNSNYHNPQWIQNMPSLTSSMESQSQSSSPPEPSERKLREALLSLASACNTPSSPVLTRSGVKTAVGATVVANANAKTKVNAKRKQKSAGKINMQSVLPLPPLESVYEGELRRSVTQTSNGTNSWHQSSVSSSSSTSSQYSQSHSQLRTSPRSSSSQSHYHDEQYQYHQSCSYINHGQGAYIPNRNPNTDANFNDNLNTSAHSKNGAESLPRVERLPLDASMSMSMDMDMNYPPTVERKASSSNGTGTLWNHDFGDDYVPLTAVGKLIQQLSLEQNKGGSGFAAMRPRVTNHECHQNGHFHRRQQ